MWAALHTVWVVCTVLCVGGIFPYDRVVMSLYMTELREKWEEKTPDSA